MNIYNDNNNFSIAFSYKDSEVRINEESVTFISRDLNINIQNLGKDIKIINFNLEKGRDSPFTLKSHKHCDPNKEFKINHLNYAYCTVSPIKSKKNQPDRLTITITNLADATIKKLNYTLIKNMKFSNLQAPTNRRNLSLWTPSGSIPIPFEFIPIENPTQQNQNQSHSTTLGPARNAVRCLAPRQRAEPYPTFEYYTVPTKQIFPERQN